MQHKITIFFILSLLAVSPVFGQTDLLVGRSNVNFDLSTGEMTIGDSSTLSYNSMLQHSQYKNWHLDASGNWRLNSRLTDFAYDANGNVLNYIIQNGDDNIGWTNFWRYTYTYDVNSNELSNKEEQWENGNWVTQAETHNVYNVNGQLLSSTGLNSRTIYTYNSLGLLKTKLYQESPGGTWLNSTRYEYTYLPNDSLYASETTYIWINYNWVGFERITNTHDTNGHIVQSLIENWEGGVWKKNLLISNTYDAEGYLTQKLIQYWNATSWENTHRSSQNYDAAHNLIYSIAQNWAAGVWRNNVQQFNSYDAKSNILNARTESWDDGNWVLSNYARFNYLKFVSAQTPEFTPFEVFPNPASTSITLTGTGLSRAMIFDLQGKLVLMQTLQGQAPETLRLGTLPSGNYILQVLSKDGKLAAKPLQIRD